MRKIKNNPCYKGVIKSPSSKSYMQRAIAIALLSEGETTLTNPCFCKDVEAVLAIAENLGAEVAISAEKVTIKPIEKLRKTQLNVGESGLGIRMLTPIASLYSKVLILIGEGSLKTRPMQSLETPLQELGVNISTNNGLLPIKVKGPLVGGNAIVDGSIGSQVLTGLLIALPKALKSSKLEVIDLQSKPYIDMTMEIMEHFGVKITHEDYKIFYIEGGQSYKATNYQIEGDWSGAAFHLVGAAIAGDVTLTNINPASKQADVKIIEALRSAGAKISLEENSIRVEKDALKAFHFDATHCPDLFPPLANLAVACEGISVIKGVGRLTHKESNRAEAIKKVWTDLGVEVTLLGDEMHIKGGKVKGGNLHSHNDHRIAMMGAIASLIAEGPINIEQWEAVGKSYPTFFEDFNVLRNVFNLKTTQVM